MVKAFKVLVVPYASTSRSDHRGSLARSPTGCVGAAELGFVVEDDGHSEQVVVFMPSAPTPAAGSVAVVPRARVRRLDVPPGVAIATVTRLGMGLQTFCKVKRAVPRMPAGEV